MMRKIIITFVTLLIGTSFTFSKTPNTSFKIGIPYSTVQALLGARNVSGKNFTPTLGLSYFSVNSKSKRTEDGETDESDIAVRFFIPRLGARILGKHAEELNSYFIGEAFLVIPFISGSDISSEEKTDFKDATDLIGLTAGWGVEYFFSPSFSIGGEATFNMIFHNFTSEDYDEWDDYSYKRELKTRLGATITQITFNYYFR